MDRKNKDWIQRWETKEIGWHQELGNTIIQSFVRELFLNKGATLFFPLCGKTYDMAWSLSQGMKVIGVELSSTACEDFFTENSLAFTKKTVREFTVYESDNIQLYCGDLFELTCEDLKEVELVIDRASLIALPPALQKNYVSHLENILPSAQKVLFSLEYQQGVIEGPPFSITRRQINDYYQSQYELKVFKEHISQMNEQIKHVYYHLKEYVKINE